MVFGNMGSPLEHFQVNSDKSTDATVNYYNCNDEYTIMQGDDKFCMVKTDVELSEDTDMFGKFDNASTNWTDDNFNCSDDISLSVAGSKYCKHVSEDGSGNNNSKEKKEQFASEGDEDGEGDED